VNNSATLRIGGVQFGPTLHLKRTPLYLRFVYSGRDCKTLDALDQLDDEAKDSEDIIVARCVRHGNVHVDRTVNGRRVGEWFTQAEYEPIEPQPQRNDVALKDDWAKWVAAYHAKQVAAK
jgi:hypothetical protein